MSDGPVGSQLDRIEQGQGVLLAAVHELERLSAIHHEFIAEKIGALEPLLDALGDAQRQMTILMDEIDSRTVNQWDALEQIKKQFHRKPRKARKRK
jgi:hypothetical protein